MKLSTIILLLLIPILAFSFSNFVKAANQELSGYIYSETAGWISLNCSNTNSCNTVDYKVTKDSNGKLWEGIGSGCKGNRF